MNGIDKILQKISAEADLECRNIADEAVIKCDEILSAYEAKAKLVYDETLESGKREIEQNQIRELCSARMQAKDDVLKLKQNLVQSAFDNAKNQILNLSSDEYIDFLANLAAKASSDGNDEIILSSKDAQTIGKQVVNKANSILESKKMKANLRLSDECKDITGMILKHDNVEVNCTIDALLQQARVDMESKVSEMIFG